MYNEPREYSFYELYEKEIIFIGFSLCSIILGLLTGILISFII